MQLARWGVSPSSAKERMPWGWGKWRYPKNSGDPGESRRLDISKGVQDIIGDEIKLLQILLLDAALYFIFKKNFQSGSVMRLSS